MVSDSAVDTAEVVTGISVLLASKVERLLEPIKVVASPGIEAAEEEEEENCDELGSVAPVMLDEPCSIVALDHPEGITVDDCDVVSEAVVSAMVVIDSAVDVTEACTVVDGAVEEEDCEELSSAVVGTCVRPRPTPSHNTIMIENSMFRFFPVFFLMFFGWMLCGGA